MTMKKPTSILIPTDWEETFQDLPDGDAALLIRAAFAWNRGEEPELPAHIAPFAKLLKTTICRAAKKYSSTCYNHSEAARKREAEKREAEKSTEPEDCENVSQDVTKNTVIQNCEKTAQKAQSTTIVNNKNKNKNKNKNINTPPRGSAEGGSARKIEILKNRLDLRFKRSKVTAWSPAEISAMAAIMPRPNLIAEYWEISRYYRSGFCKYPRRTVLSLLQNWTGELDKARSPHVNAAGVVRLPVASEQQKTQFTTTQRGLGGLAQ